MPIYEFICTDCKHPFEQLVGFGKAGQVACPACSGTNVDKQISLIGGSRISGHASQSTRACTTST